jgi:hypothetical protein
MVSWSRGSGIGRLLVLGGIVGKSVHDLNTDLLGKGEFDLLAGGGSQFGVAFLDGD